MDTAKLLILVDGLRKAFDEDHGRRTNLETVSWMISSRWLSRLAEDGAGDRKQA